MGYRYVAPIIKRPQDDPDFAPSCPFPRVTPIDFKTDRSWYPLICDPNAESKAARFLTERGFRPYWPRYTKHYRNHAGQQRPRTLSVIGGVVIIPMPTGRETFDAVRAVPKVREFMLLNGFPQRLGEYEIGEIRKMEANLNLPSACTNGLPDWCKVGVKVTVLIVGDENWDLTGPIIELAGGQRIVVEVMLLGCRRPITVTASQIEPI